MTAAHNTEARAIEVINRCEKLAHFSQDSGSTRRTFLSPPMRDCHREITCWLEAAGAEVYIDAAGNLRAFYPGSQPAAPRLMLGSHLDTVPNAGAYDGVLGVALAVALLENLNGRKLPFALEVIGFSEEEGVRFGTPFIGSRALAGTLHDELLEVRDREGVSLGQAIRNFGLDPAQIPGAALNNDTVGYLEFHIEQGPVLENLKCPLGAVETISGQSRLEFKFMGRAGHAGTTPMQLRCDPLAGAAEWITTVEKVAKIRYGLVATVGNVAVVPGATNVIAGEVSVSLDVRHCSDDIRVRAVEELSWLAEEIVQRRGLSLIRTVLLSQKAVFLNPFLVDEVEKAMRKAGCVPQRMVSGAGHDAMIVAEKVPAAMIFLRTPGGISHQPEETVHVHDVAKAIDCGIHLLDQLADSTPVRERRQIGG